MDRPNHIENYLCTVRSGQWFSFSDPNDKIYANLVVHDGGSKPSETETCSLELCPINCEYENNGLWINETECYNLESTSSAREF